MDYPDSDNWADSLVQLAIYEDGGNADTAGMGGLHQWMDRWRVLERRRWTYLNRNTTKQKQTEECIDVLRSQHPTKTVNLSALIIAARRI